jgi:cell division protein FtsZ
MPFIEAKPESMAKIKVVGVGGGGQNAIGSMISQGQGEGVEFIVMNTDLQALRSSKAQVQVQLGPQSTHGLGSGADPSRGYEAAQESLNEIKSHLQGADMVFVAAGMGGGTGSGAAPVVAQVAKETGGLTVGVVTKPFVFEGKRRMNQAEQGIRELKDKVDALIVIPNEKLLEVVDENVSLLDAFKIADQVIGQAVDGISDLITSTGLVNVDFADVKTIMKNAGSALMGIGEAEGENRAEEAAKKAINSPLLDVDIKGSTGILINIVGDASLSMFEVNKAAKIISDAAHEAANIIFGANIDPEVKGIKVTVIATGFDSDFRTMNMGEFASSQGEQVLHQIETRFEQDSPNGDIVEEVEEVIEYEETGGEFDIERMREQLRKTEEIERKMQQQQEQDDLSGDNDQTSTSSDDSDDDDDSDSSSTRPDLWSFIKRRR